MNKPCHIAVDLGADSGRVVRGWFANGHVGVEEIRRFPNGIVPVLGHKHWNLLRLYDEILQGLKSAACGEVESIGVDSWGVDYVLLDQDDQLLGLPYSYRDARTNGMMDRLFAQVPAEKVYAATGNQFLQFNTLFQLFSMIADGPSRQLEAARALLMVPDYLHYLLGGQKTNEYTNASTTQCLNVHSRQWDAELLAAVGIPGGIFHETVLPGSSVGRLTPELQALTGLPDVAIIAPATHDTASAVAGVPAQGEDWAYISSGTWSLMGVETPQPVATPQARTLGFTNEGGIDGTIRLLRNIVGLWLVQQLRLHLGITCSHAELADLAAKEKPFAAIINPDDPLFFAPESMPQAFVEFCQRTGQQPPQTPAAFVRAALDGLALQYRYVLEQLNKLLTRPVRRIHVIGGGSQNRLLCQLTADACGLPVLAGPVEATAMGNLALQARAKGHVSSLAEARQWIANSCELIEYQPRTDGGLERVWKLFLTIKGRT